uniref:Protein kinase domain-containing protein n=1 Tax=Biomphalaria glabrata TaxID=6526 RepID=A0A2C9L5F9_BIOGL
MITGILELTVLNVSTEQLNWKPDSNIKAVPNISVLCDCSFIGDGSSLNSKWKRKEQIGCGSSCKVYKAVYPYRGFEYEIAVKEVQINLSKKAKERLEKSVNTEINILKKLRHKNIVQYFGHFQDEFNYFIFMELLNAGPLSHYIDDNREKPKGLKHSLVVKFTRQILNGLKCIHEERIIHRDIKAENILVTNMENIKIADFGISKVFEKFSKASTRGVGTLRYMAPERFGSDSYSYPVDIWAVGCVVFEMITGSLPFKKFEDYQIFKVMSEARPFPFLHCDNAMLLSTKDKEFLAYIFKKDPEERPTVDELIINSYLAD